MIPAESDFLYSAAQRYVDRYNSDNNSDPSTNGEERLLRHVLPSLREKGVVFDVGANVGNWTGYCLSMEPHLNVHLFEPSKTTFATLSTKSWRGGARITVNNCGLGEKDEFLELNIVDPISGLNSLHKRHGVNGAEVTAVERIKITTLDNYCEKNGIDHIDFLKVDVEGHELAVFRGARRMLVQGAIDLIQFEYGGCNLDARVYLLDIWEYLTENGYQIAKIYPNYTRRIPHYNQKLETFRYCNFIAYLNNDILK